MQAIEPTPPEKIMTGRRVLFVVLFAATMAGSLALAALALSPGGFSVVDIAILVLFAVTLPWTVAGFWNAVIGFLIMRFAADPIAAVMPVAAGIRGDEPMTASTAILMCIRNEMPERVIRNLEPMMGASARPACGDRFHVYVLSDTSDAEIAAHEEARFARSHRAGAAVSRSLTGAAPSIPATRPATSATSASAGAASTNSP